MSFDAEIATDEDLVRYLREGYATEVNRREYWNAIDEICKRHHRAMILISEIEAVTKMVPAPPVWDEVRRRSLERLDNTIIAATK